MSVRPVALAWSLACAFSSVIALVSVTERWVKGARREGTETGFKPFNLR